MAFLDKVLGKDDRESKLKQEINSLELRKATVFSSIDGEIARLRNERSNVLLAAGTAAFEAWNNGNMQADLVEFWNVVQEKDKLIEEQEAKKIEMGNRYDEEIKLIGGNLNLGVSTETGMAIKTCPKCNNQVGLDDAFCQGCGTKM